MSLHEAADGKHEAAMLQTSRLSKPGPGLLHHLLMHEDILDLLSVITQSRGELSIKLLHTGDLHREADVLDLKLRDTSGGPGRPSELLFKTL